MNIYCATKFERADQQRDLNHMIRTLGHGITHDWTLTENTSDGVLTAEQRHAAGMMDYAGVMQADLLILWDSPDYHLNGARWEAGMAAARGIPIWIIEYSHEVIFDVLPQVSVFESWDAVLSLLKQPNPLG